MAHQTVLDTPIRTRKLSELPNRRRRRLDVRTPRPCNHVEPGAKNRALHKRRNTASLKNIRLLIMETPTERRNVKTYSKDDLGSIYLDMKTSDPFVFGETQVREIQFTGSPS